MANAAEIAAPPTPAKPPPKLVLVEPKHDPDVNVFLYGQPKTGKTVGAASAPKPLLYLNAEPNSNSTAFAHKLHEFDEAKVEGLDTLIAATHAAEKGKYKTVVVDPLNELYRVLLEELSQRRFSPTLQQYGDTGTHLERFCRKLFELPLNVVLVAHELTHKDEESGGFERLPFTGTNNPAIGAKLMAAVDVIGYTGIVEQESGPPRYVAQLINARGRRGGDRFGVLGPARELNLTEWVEEAHKSLKKETSKPPSKKETAAKKGAA